MITTTVALAMGLLLLGGCAAERGPAVPGPSRSVEAAPSASAGPTPDPTIDADPIPSPSIVPGPEYSGTPAPMPSSQGSVDGWTYAMLRSVCRDWVTNRSPKNANERWAFDSGEPAQKFEGAWNMSFYGVFDSPDLGDDVQSAISCGVTGTPADPQVGPSGALGDAQPEALLYP